MPRELSRNSYAGRGMRLERWPKCAEASLRGEVSAGLRASHSVRDKTHLFELTQIRRYFLITSEVSGVDDALRGTNTRHFREKQSQSALFELFFWLPRYE